MTYAEKVKKLREVMLISQGELAEILSVSVVTVNRWEIDKFEPTIKIKRKLQAIFKENNIKTEGEEK
ncbi:MAG: helix-turn-helix transcriptional regulator [Candidatus Cloacimonetes bacterium]|nr:helix-turn-helix transcriptional regulator [Candidatus Cloacimonadota bacterium]